MANEDLPNGFEPIGTLDGGAIKISRGNLNASETVAVGDALILSSGRLSIAAYTSGHIVGVVAPQGGATGLGQNVASSSSADDEILYYDARHIFAGQCSGTYAATMEGTACDIEGTTGIMEINEGATIETVVMIRKEITGNHRGRVGLTTGANSMVEFIIARPGFGGVTVDQTS